MPGYVSTLVVMQSDGAATAASAETTLLNAQAKWTIPAGYIDRPGKKFLLTASGRASTVATPGTLTMRVKFGSIAVSTSSAWALKASVTNVGWWLELYLTVRSIGSGTAATIFGQGDLSSEMVSGSGSGLAGGIMWQASAPAVGTGFDTTVANQIDLTAQTATSTTNSYTCHTFSLMDTTTTP